LKPPTSQGVGGFFLVLRRCAGKNGTRPGAAPAKLKLSRLFFAGGSHGRFPVFFSPRSLGRLQPLNLYQDRTTKCDAFKILEQLQVPDDLNKKKSIVRLKDELVDKIPYTPKDAESKKFLLNHDIGDLLHIYHFCRQRLLQAVPRDYQAPASIRNSQRYIRNKNEINCLRRKIESGEDLSAYLSHRAHTKAIDITDYQNNKNFICSRDNLLVREGFYHLHLAPFPKRTDEIIVAHVTNAKFEIVGIFTHKLFDGDDLDSSHPEYQEAVNAYLSRKLPDGGVFLGGPGGAMQNAAGSSAISSFWQIHCRKILSRVENHPDGINGFTIKLYGDLFGRQTKFVDPKWVVAEDWRLLIQDRKNKHEFWADGTGKWYGQPIA